MRAKPGEWKFALVASDLPMRAKYIGLVLAVHFDRSGRCWPSIDTLATESGQSKKTVVKYLAELEGREWVEREKGSGPRSTKYQAILGVVPPEGTSSGSPEGTTHGDASGFPQDASGFPQDHSGSLRGNPNSKNSAGELHSGDFSTKEEEHVCPPHEWTDIGNYRVCRYCPTRPDGKPVSVGDLVGEEMAS